MPPLRAGSRFVSAALLLGLAAFGSRVVGLLRERIMATTLGATSDFDAFVAAFRIPDLLFNLIVIGALSASFIPLFTDKLIDGKKGQREAFDFASSILTILLVLMVGVSALYFLAAPLIVPLITPGFSAEAVQITVKLSRIMALQPVFLAISFVFSGILNSYKRFTAYALAPIFYNFGIIFGVLVLLPSMGLPGLAWGVVLGAVMHALVQLPSIYVVGFRWRPLFRWSATDLKKVWRMMVPRAFGLAAQQVNLLVVTVVGSGLVAGSITAFHLASNVQHVPVGIFGLAFAQAAFPTLAEQMARKQRRAFLATLTTSFRYILFFVIPVSVFFFLLRAQIIRVLFGDGAFDWEDTFLTLETFGVLSASIFAQATIPLLTRAFYVQHDTRTPVLISLGSIVLNILLAAWLAPWSGIQGLALAFSISAIFQLLFLLGRLHWQFGGFNDREVLVSAARISLAALAAGLMLQAMKYPVAAVVDMQRFWGVFTQLFITGGGGVIVYFLVCRLLGCEELKVLQRYFPRKMRSLSAPSASSFGDLPD